MRRISNLVLMVLPCVALLAPSLPALDTGDKAPPFANPDLNNRHVLSRDYVGKGWLLIDFFATDCEGCEKELPVLERLHREYAPSRLQILVFATDTGGFSVLTPYFRSRPTPLPVLVDRYRVAVKKYGVSEIPALFIVSPEGLIVYQQVGFTEDLYDRIRTLLGH
jgi:thiol-disulfide isomerase/thioredoxin